MDTHVCVYMIHASPLSTGRKGCNLNPISFANWRHRLTNGVVICWRQRSTVCANQPKTSYVSVVARALARDMEKDWFGGGGCCRLLPPHKWPTGHTNTNTNTILRRTWAFCIDSNILRILSFNLFVGLPHLTTGLRLWGPSCLLTTEYLVTLWVCVCVCLGNRIYGYKQAYFRIHIHSPTTCSYVYICTCANRTRYSE